MIEPPLVKNHIIFARRNSYSWGNPTLQGDYRFHTFLEDPAYRVSAANENAGCNQPAEPGFYLGSELKGKKFRGTTVK